MEILEVKSPEDLSRDITTQKLCTFLHREMQPYEDTPSEIERGLGYALSSEPTCHGGFVLCAMQERELIGALVLLHTGMGGYVPENLLLYVAVASASRGRGYGAQLIHKAASLCEGSIKLHVEHDNPARRLYDRLGFTSKYAEMRLSNE